jgi:hypothetical protein
LKTQEKGETCGGAGDFTPRMEDEGGKMKNHPASFIFLLSFAFILHLSHFIFSLSGGVEIP